MLVNEETRGLHEKRARLITQMEDIKNQAKKEERQLSKEEGEKFDKFDQEAEAILADIRRIDRVAELSKSEQERILEAAKKSGKSENEQEDTEKRYADVFKKYMKNGENALSAEERNFLHTRAQSVGTTTEGGFLVPQGFANTYHEALLATSPLLAYLQSKGAVIRTTSGNSIPYPNIDDTANSSVILAENAAAASSKDFVYGSTTLIASVLHPDVIKVPYQLMQDSAFNMEQHVASLLGKRDARGLTSYFTTGTGSSQPKGIVTESTSGKTTASETAFTAAEIIALEHSVDPEYRNGAVFMMHDTILREIKKLVIDSTDARPLWDPAIMKIGTPATILGYEYLVNQNMASSLAADNKVMIFGNIANAYRWRIVNEFTVIRLNELYAGNLQVGFSGYSRHDGRKISGSSVYPWKHLTMVNT